MGGNGGVMIYDFNRQQGDSSHIGFTVMLRGCG